MRLPAEGLPGKGYVRLPLYRIVRRKLRLSSAGEYAEALRERVKERVRSELKDKQGLEVPEARCFTGFDAYKKVIELSDMVCIANAAAPRD